MIIKGVPIAFATSYDGAKALIARPRATEMKLVNMRIPMKGPKASFLSPIILKTK
jgi:hypothetical protein